MKNTAPTPPEAHRSAPEASMASVQAMLSPTRIANSGRPVLATGAQVRSEFGRTSSYFAVLETTVAGSGGEGHARVRR